MEQEKFILVADDNKSIIDILKKYLIKEGYSPISAYNGKEALEKFRSYSPSLVLLDVLMPEKDGYQVCQEIRKESNVPIIMLTAKTEDRDKIMGLDMGADDYIVKPFSPGEVMARIRSIMRRVETKEGSSGEILRKANLFVNIAEFKVTVDGQLVSLTKKETELIWLLASNPSRVYSRDVLLDKIWGFDYLGDVRTVDTHIKRLRAKLELFPHASWDIKTIWGVGYKFELIGEENHEK